MGQPRVIQDFFELEQLIRPGNLIGTDFRVLETVDTAIREAYIYTEYKALLRLMRVGPVDWRLMEIRPIEHPSYDEYRVVEGSEVQPSGKDEKD